MINQHLDNECIFCKIIKGEIPSLKLLETDLNYAFLDIGPASEGHSLIIPKYHCHRMDQVPDEYLTEVGPLAKKIALATDCVDYNILQNNGKIAYQHVFHVHFHVIPRRNKDEGITELKWPRVERPLSELTGVLKKMQERLETNAKANM